LLTELQNRKTYRGLLINTIKLFAKLKLSIGIMMTDDSDVGIESWNVL